MRKLHVLGLVALLPLAACGRNDPPAATSGGAGQADAPPAETALGRVIQQAMGDASTKLATGNIAVGGRDSNGFHFGNKPSSSNLPKAEITPQGDFLVDGKAVPVDERQRKLLLAHRAQVVAIAQAGIAIGMRGADLGVKAAGGALKSVFSGATDDFEKQMEAEGKRIEAEADKLCALTPGLLASQQALAAALPEFVPYATMDQSDVDGCGKDGDIDLGNDDPAPTAGASGAHDDATGAGDDSGDHNVDAAAEADAAAQGSSARQ